MILLTGSNTPIAVSIVGIVIVVGLAGLYYFVFYSKNKQKAKDAANDFLSGLADEFYKLMVKEIKEFNIEEFDFESLEDYEANLMKAIYDMIYDYTMKKLEDASKDDILTTLAIKMITREAIEQIADTVINNGNIKGLIKDTWAKYFENKVQGIEDTEDIAVGHDIDGNEIIYSGNEYNEDFDEKNDLSVVEDEIIDENDLSNIVPPSEDENTSFDEDVVMDGEPEKPYINPEERENPEDLPIGYTDIEASEDDIEDVSYFIDKNGRKRDKITGRYTK